MTGLRGGVTHQYIPNSAPRVKEEMLREIGVGTAGELFERVLKDYEFKGKLRLPPPRSEQEVKREVGRILAKNRTAAELSSFLGAGCWQHVVPEVCNEINSRSEFLTAYTGDVYSDLWRFQALFEFQSMIGDLVSMEAVTYPTYDWATAAGDSIRMALAAKSRSEILVPGTMSREKAEVMGQYLGPRGRLRTVGYDGRTGQIDLEDLRRRVTNETAAVYIENPSYLGFLEAEAEEVGEIAHAKGALFIAGVEPLSLGALKPPGEYGADIVCGEGQPLGLKPYFGGAMMGFVACRDDAELLTATGNRLITITGTSREGERGFAFALPERVMFNRRESSNTFTGTTAALWAITAAVFLSLLGPNGLRDLAEAIMQKSHYAAKLLSEATGAEAPVIDSPFFQEFTVNFGKREVKDVNAALLKEGIQGGKDVSDEFPQYGNTALYCVTEVNSQEEIQVLAEKIRGLLL